MKLGLLDVSGQIDHALELAPRVEQLGYTRYWIAEHQPQPSPLLMATIIAGQTERIRVGTAGVLLHYYPLLRTAHDFRFLERVFPDRIDAGVCGGVVVRRALVDADGDNRDVAAAIAAYPERVAQLARYIRAGADPDLAWPLGFDEPPQIWSLGGGLRSAELAARQGLSFGYSLLFDDNVDNRATVDRYRERFVPHPDLASPAVVIAIAGVCAPTDDEARAFVTRIGRSAGFTPRVVGSPQTCAAQLAEITSRYDVDEVVFADLWSELPLRVRGHELLAAAVLGT